MKLENFEERTVIASHEVIESIVDQTFYVAIWKHETFDDGYVWSYEKRKLPDGFRCLVDVARFTEEKPLEGYTSATSVSIDVGKIKKHAYYDNLDEPLARLARLIQKRDR
jgi:hypothetical protein